MRSTASTPGGTTSPDDAGGIDRPVDDEAFLFHAVYVPGSFRYLHPFLGSLLANSRVRARIVANGCPPDEVAQMRALAERSSGRIEVHIHTTGERVEHGEVLNALYELDPDSEFFCFVDTDVMARGPWIEPFVEAMRTCAGVSSAHPTWDPSPTAPEELQGLRGHFVFGSDGYLFGSSYLALYRRAAVDEIRSRWHVDFRRSTHEALEPATRARMSELGRYYSFYDTAKIINVLLQLDGYQVGYVDGVPLVHIGAMSILDYYVNTPRELWPEPHTEQVTDKLARDTIEMAANVAALLMEVVDGARPAPIPHISDPALERWLVELEPDIRAMMQASGRPIPG